MGHFVKVVPTKTFRINPSVVRPYNADFDGDEMNVHVPQTEESRAEAKHLLNLERHIVTPRYGASIIGIVEDALLGLYVLTRDDTALTRAEVSDLLTAAGVDFMPEPSKSGKEEAWSGKQIFSAVLPEDLEFEHADVTIKKGQLKTGVASEKLLGPEQGFLLHHLYLHYGPTKTREVINSLNRLGLEAVRQKPYSMSFSDIEISDKATNRIRELISEGEREVKKILKEFKLRKIVPVPGRTVRETVEAKILSTLNRLRAPVGEIVEKEAKEGNQLVLMSRAGMAALYNLAQMAGFVGQQALRGKRIHTGYNSRTLPHFRRGDISARARGFIRNSYGGGMDPVETWYNAIVGRDSYIDSAVRTPKSGYLQRRLINALQDLKTTYDSTVRDSGEKIVQFLYGEDNIDVSKSKQGSVPTN
jgi:DNA-directed RNA polymerase subunit A'